jgi:DNA-binding transcriptional MerR regulator
MGAEQLSRLLPAAEVARIFGRTLRTLSNWEKAGLLVPVRIRGQRLYRISDVERVLDGSTFPAPREGF